MEITENQEIQETNLLDFIVQVVLLKSGEEIVTEIRKVKDTETEKRYYIFNRPYNIKIVSTDVVQISPDESRPQLNIEYSPWIMFTEDEQMIVPEDWVVTTVNPKQQIRESYLKNRRIANEQRNGSTTEE